MLSTLQVYFWTLLISTYSRHCVLSFGCSPRGAQMTMSLPAPGPRYCASHTHPIQGSTTGAALAPPEESTNLLTSPLSVSKSISAPL